MWISKRHYNLLESELDHYRQRCLALERENARLHDSLLLSNGTPPVTDVVRRETAEQQGREESVLEQRKREMAEIFGQTMQAVGGTAIVPEEFRNDVEALEAWQTKQ